MAVARRDLPPAPRRPRIYQPQALTHFLVSVGRGRCRRRGGDLATLGSVRAYRRPGRCTASRTVGDLPAGPTVTRTKNRGRVSCSCLHRNPCHTWVPGLRPGLQPRHAPYRPTTTTITPLLCNVNTIQPLMHVTMSRALTLYAMLAATDVPMSRCRTCRTHRTRPETARRPPDRPST